MVESRLKAMLLVSEIIRGKWISLVSSIASHTIITLLWPAREVEGIMRDPRNAFTTQIRARWNRNLTSAIKGPYQKAGNVQILEKSPHHLFDKLKHLRRNAQTPTQALTF